SMSPRERREFLDQKQRLAGNVAEFESRYGESETVLESTRANLRPGTRRETADALVQIANKLAEFTQEISLTKALARLESVTLEPMELSSVDALQIARVHRLDWMNARASLVDQWRLIAFNANALRSNLTVTINGDMGTLGNNPLRFESATGNFTAGLRFDAPITRLAERNNYRQALIQYQQQRRALIQFEDATNLGLRQDLRVLKQLEVNLEIQRRAVAIAIRRVDNTREVLSRPPDIAAAGQAAASTLSPTAAINMISALQALSDSQNNFMSVWLQYYSNRLETYVDLGIMRLDERGMWIDEPLDKNLAALEEMYPLPPELPVDWLRAGGLDPETAPAALPNEGVPQLDEQEYEQTPGELKEGLEVPGPHGGILEEKIPAPAEETPAPEGPADADEAAAKAPAKRTLRTILFGGHEAPKPSKVARTAASRRPVR
ncbi:MAG TPA: TolC family protein, partial [Pirellulales bacterium]|nr:TolC family protein [Pirellulales bacterium]